MAQDEILRGSQDDKKSLMAQDEILRGAQDDNKRCNAEPRRMTDYQLTINERDPSQGSG